MAVDEIEVVKLDNDGDSPLAMASHKGHIDIVRLLLPIGDVANLRNKKGVTPVFLAAENGHLEIVRLLVEVGVDVCLKDKHGFMPLHMASQNGHAPIVAELLLMGKENDKRMRVWRTISPVIYLRISRKRARRRTHT